MKLNLKKKVSAKYLIEGFPGVGLVAPITTEYLLSHMNFEKIGEVVMEDVPPIAAVHNSEVIKPISLYYSKKKNLVMIHSVSNIAGLEWKIKDIILDLHKQLKIKTVVSIEGIANPDAKTSSPKSFIYANKAKLIPKSLKDLLPLKEGIIMGVTGALMLNNENFNHLCIFVDANLTMPDSKAAAKVIKALDDLLGLNVDFAPLLKKAEIFEKKLNTIVQQSQVANKISDKKKLDYFG